MGAPILQVPDRFNRNSSKVSDLLAPEESGRWLLQQMQQRLGIADYAGVALLDFGCGVRFSQAILNLGLPIGRYAGVDCFGEMIDFLKANVHDVRFSYELLNARHPLYNPDGEPLTTETRLPLPEQAFDVISMFSVITHQDPPDAEAILTMLRRYVRPAGQLFLTCFLDPALASFEDRSPDRNGGYCVYEPSFLEALLHRSGWQPFARYPGGHPLIADSFACRPSTRPPPP